MGPAEYPGVGSALAGAGLSSNVATYIDGFYMPATLGNDFDLISVSNVSVLKGRKARCSGATRRAAPSW